MRKFEDTYRHKGMRKKLIDSIRGKGITDERVLEAMMNIPRHYFLDTALDHIAYEDRAFPIQEGQTISQPIQLLIKPSCWKLNPMIKYSK